MAPLAPHERVLVSQEYFKTDHAEKMCEECHGGNPAGASRAEAHKGVVKDPTEAPPFGAAEKLVCAECHEEQAKTAQTSLHATLSSFSVVLKARTGDDNDAWEKVVDVGRKNHCTPCHSSCGQCHVSRPKFAKSGLIKGHVFLKKPDMVNQCMACHGSRVGDEYTGDRGLGDAHFSKKGMDCMACHNGAEMHASGAGLTSRYLVPQMPKCTGCHGAEQLGKVAQHKDHAGKLQCQGCHSQDYVNCYSCHTAKDDNKVAYFVNQLEVESFKIGLNYPGTGLDEKYVVVRHEPTDKEVFDFYGKDAFKAFDSVPTWKRASPHNIQRRTWRNASCNHCHGQRGVFLAESDLLAYEKGANRAVVVPDDKIPAKRAEDTFKAPEVKVQGSMLAKAEALHEVLAKKEPVVVDARDLNAYKKGHIAGAVLFNVMAELRYPPNNTPRSMTMRSPEELAAVFGKLGIDREARVVVYDNGGLEAPFLAFALWRLGNEKVSVLDGGVDAWAKEARFPLVAGDPAAAAPKTFTPAVKQGATMLNRDVAPAMQDPNTVILDVRSVAQYEGLRGHPLVQNTGHLEKSINLSVRGLWSPEGFLRDPEEIAWLLESRGVTKDRKVIVTCSTGQAAAGAWFALTYVGYPNVALHDGSWVSWERSPMFKK